MHDNSSETITIHEEFRKLGVNFPSGVYHLPGEAHTVPIMFHFNLAALKPAVISTLSLVSLVNSKVNPCTFMC